MKLPFRKKRLTSFQTIIFGFSAVILLGALLLMLPISCTEGNHAGFLDALFTSTSAVCVTGLVVRDTASYWTIFGQSVILILIQIGGMGVVTLAIAITAVTGKKIGLMQRSTLQEAISAHQMGGIVKLAGFIIRTTLFIELSGAILLTIAFTKYFDISTSIRYGLFHSVSAFCNAGFDLMGNVEHFSSLTSFVGHISINLIIAFLIIIGGIGFLTWEDLKTNRWHVRSWRMQTRVILATTLILLLIPFLYFYFDEFARPQWAYLTEKERLLASIFQSVTPRTAGFNTVPMSTISEIGQFVIIILMLIGGSPGSTAGGMKTTTIAVLFCAAISVFRREDHVRCFRRKISSDTVSTAATLLLFYIVMFIAGGFLICRLEHLPIMSCMFEAASAIGTVGLSVGITPNLCSASRIILIILMFFGRVGTLTLIFAAASGKKAYTAQYPVEKITVG